MTTISMGHLIHQKDGEDSRDLPFEPAGAEPPASATLAQYCPEPYNQLNVKSCSANAIAAALLLLAAQSKGTLAPPSRLFLYYNARVAEGDPTADDGAAIRDALKAATTPGLCPETLWPYDVTKVLDKPGPDAYAGVHARIAEYRRIPRKLTALKSCIAGGLPFLFGIQIYTSVAQTAMTTGVLNEPQANDTLMGGHALLAIGYDDGKGSITALNSCGPATGDHGYFHVPYTYFTDEKLTYDFWTICKVG